MTATLRMLMLSVGLACVTSPSWSQTRYQAIGSGAKASCGTWTEMRRNSQASDYEQWLLGFLSGVGWTHGTFHYNPLNGLDANAVWRWMDNYCQASPLNLIHDGAVAFVDVHPR